MWSTHIYREYYVPDVRYEVYLTKLGELIIGEPLARQLSFLTAESDKVHVESQGRKILFILHVKLCFQVNLHSI